MENLHEYIVYSEDFGAVNSPAFYDCCVHLLCKAGQGNFSYADKHFTIRQGEIAIISHPQKVSDINWSDGMACEFIAAPYRYLQNLLPANNYSIQGGVSLFANPIIKVAAEDAAVFHDDLQNIRRRIDSIDHRFYKEMMGGLLQTMMYDLFDFHSQVNDAALTTDRVGYITSKFFSLLEAGCPKIHRSVAWYAAQLHVTAKYLAETIKRVTGTSVSAHINRAASAIMSAYLRDNKLSITQIADEMQFASVSYFSRYCKKQLGQSPGEVRRVNAIP